MDEISIARNGQLAFLAQGYYFAQGHKINPILKWPQGEPSRIGILGSHGVGKTTLAKALSNELHVTRIDEVARTVLSLGFELNDQATIQTQLLMWLGQLWEEQDLEEFVADRTLLDVVVYSNYMRAKLSPKELYFLNAIEALTYQHMLSYSALIYVPIEFDPEDDGVRSTDLEFQNEIDVLFKSYLNKFQLDYYPVTGSPSERLQRTLSYLRESGHSCPALGT